MRSPALFPCFAILLLIVQLASPQANAGTDSLGFDLLGLSEPVMDTANLLNPDQEARLVKRLQQYKAASSNHVMVVTLPSLLGTSVEDLVAQLSHRWSSDQETRNKSILLIVAPGQQVVHIEVGEGLIAHLPDATVRAIVDEYILPFFRKNDYAYGIAIGVDSILGALKGTFSPPSSEPTGEEMSYLSSPFIYVFLLLGMGLMFCLKDRFGVPEVDSHLGDDWRRGGRSRWFGGRGRGGGGSGGGDGGGFGGHGSSGSW